MIYKNDFDGNLVYGGAKFHKQTKRDKIIVDKKFPHYEFVELQNCRYEPKEEFFEKLDKCPLCDCNDIEFKLYKDGLYIYECNKCKFGFQNPRFKAKYLSLLYGKEYSLNGAYISSPQQKLDEIKYKYAIEQLEKFSLDKESVLDIGAGNLHFLKVCKETGFKKLIGIEPGSTLNNLSSEYEIMTEFHEEINFKDISLISMWDTLEHIHNFKLIVKSIFNSLKKGGLFIVMVPNFYSLATRLIRSDSPTFCIYHLNYFTQYSLTKLLEDSGFEVLKKESVISEIDNCRNYLEFQEPYMSIPKNETAFSWLTPEYIHKNLLGSRLLFIARKG